MVWTPEELYAYTDGAGNPFHPPKEQIILFLNYLLSLAQASGMGFRVYTTKALMDADLSPAANTLAVVVQDPDPTVIFPRRVFFKIGGPGTGSWGEGTDTFAGIFDLAAPTWMAPANDMPIYEDRGGAAGAGINKLFVPLTWTIWRNGFIKNNTAVANAASSAVGFTQYCELPYSQAGCWILYYDNGDNLIKCIERAGWNAAGFPNQANEIFIIGLFSGSQRYSQLRIHDFYDKFNPVLGFVRPLVHLLEEGKLLVPAIRLMDGTSITTQSPADGSIYTEIPIQTLGGSATPNAHYFDIGAGLPKSTSTNHPAPAGYFSTVFARSFNNIVHSPFALISKKLGNFAPNQLANGNRPIQTAIKSANLAEIAVTDAAVLLLGFSYAVHSTVLTTSTPVHVGAPMPLTQPGSSGFARAIVIKGSSDAWTNIIPRVVFLPTPNGQPVSVNMELEKIISTNARMYSVQFTVPKNDFFGNPVTSWYSYGVGAWVNNTISIDIQVTAAQFSLANGGAFIDRNDFTVQQAVNDQISSMQAQLADPSPQIMYSDHMFLAEGIPLELYPVRVFEAITASNSYSFSVVSQRTGIARKPFNKTVSGRTSIELDPTRIGPPYLVMTAVRYSDAALQGQTADYQYDLPITGHVAAAPYSGTVSVALVGDSILANDVVNYTKLELQNLGYTVNMIGTIDNVGALGEARVGIKASDIVNITTAKLPIVSVADYNARNNTQNDPNGKWGYNPHIRAATGGDPAAFVKNGYIFDYANYLTVFGLTTPTHIFFEPGTNDAWGNTFPTSVNNTLTAVDIMYTQMRASAPNAHIGIALPAPAAIGSTASTWTEEYSAIIKGILSYVKTKRTGGDTKVWCVSLWAHISPDGGYVVEGSSNVTISTDASTGMKTVKLNDYLHPFTPGRRQIAEVIASWVACTQQGV